MRSDSRSSLILFGWSPENQDVSKLKERTGRDMSLTDGPRWAKSLEQSYFEIFDFKMLSDLCPSLFPLNKTPFLSIAKPEGCLSPSCVFLGTRASISECCEGRKSKRIEASPILIPRILPLQALVGSVPRLPTSILKLPPILPDRRLLDPEINPSSVELKVPVFSLSFLDVYFRGSCFLENLYSFYLLACFQICRNFLGRRHFTNRSPHNYFKEGGNDFGI
jgi:hypothetical protein